MATASTPTSEDRRRAQYPRPVANGRNSLGEMLRRARELRGLSLERIASETKIPRRHLEALEVDNLAAIPSGFYRRAELRTYAQAVGLDQHLALAELESALAPPDSRAPREGSDRRESTSPLPYIAAAVAAIAVVGALFVGASVEPTPGSVSPVESVSGTEPPAPAQASPPVAAPPVAESVAASSAPATPVAAETTQAAAPVPAVSATELVVTTQPEGARVTVNGIGWGTTPANIRYLDPGAKRIRVSKEGYVAVEREFNLARGRRQALDIQLEPTP